jgi:hypothetical protein
MAMASLGEMNRKNKPEIAPAIKRDRVLASSDLEKRFRELQQLRIWNVGRSAFWPIERSIVVTGNNWGGCADDATRKSLSRSLD